MKQEKKIYLPSSREGCSPLNQPRYNEPQGGADKSGFDFVQLCGMTALVVLSIINLVQ